MLRQLVHEPHADGGRVALVAHHVGPTGDQPPRAVGEDERARIGRESEAYTCSVPAWVTPQSVSRFNSSSSSLITRMGGWSRYRINEISTVPRAVHIHRRCIGQMATIVPLVQPQDTFNGLREGYRREQLGNPTASPGQQPRFLGETNTPGQPIKAPKILSSAARQDQGTNVTVPYARKFSPHRNTHVCYSSA